MLILIAIVFTLINNTNAQNTGVFLEPVNITNTQRDIILSTHNNERSAHCVADLVYDDSLARVAKEYAEKCTMQHNFPFIIQGNGENIFGGTYGRVAPSSAVWSWLSEREHFNCGANEPPNAENGHYYQIVHDLTERVGCGAAKCRFMLNGQTFDFLWVVCNYNPGQSNGNPFNPQYCGDDVNCEISSTSVTTPTTTSVTTPTTTSVTTPSVTTPTPTSVTTPSVITPTTTSATTTPSVTTPTTTSATTTPPVITPTTSVTSILPPDDACVKMRDICWEKCGKPTIFPFLDNCVQDFDNTILSCKSPPGCECDIPEELQSIYSAYEKCEEFSCVNVFDRVFPGNLNWCRACGYNCGGYQQVCIDDNQFCKVVSKCSRLDMCSNWRKKRCRNVQQNVQQNIQQNVQQNTPQFDECDYIEPVLTSKIQDLPSYLDNIHKPIVDADINETTSANGWMIAFFVVILGGVIVACVATTWWISKPWREQRAADAIAVDSFVQGMEMANRQNKGKFTGVI